MEYLIPPGKEAPVAEARDVSSDLEAAKLWVKENIVEVTEVHEAREIVQKQFKSLVNDEAFAVVMAVKSEWEPKAEPVVEPMPIEEPKPVEILAEEPLS